MWRTSRILALFDPAQDVALLIAAAASECGVPTPAGRWKKSPSRTGARHPGAVRPIRISDRLWITPTWHEAPNPDAISLQLDPGLAFGTGSHPTTRLCLQWLDRELQAGESVLDYGCGSGILAIAALLGAGRALGVDIDPQAVQSSRDNAAQNAVQAGFLPAGRAARRRNRCGGGQYPGQPAAHAGRLAHPPCARGRPSCCPAFCKSRRKKSARCISNGLRWTRRCLTTAGPVCPGANAKAGPLAKA